VNATLHRPAPLPAPPPVDERPACDVDIVIPVYNEEADLTAGVERLHAYCASSLPISFRITIADNASTDATWSIAQGLAGRLPNVRAIHLDRKGRGRCGRSGRRATRPSSRTWTSTSRPT